MTLKGPSTVKLSDIKTTFFTRVNLNEDRVQVFIDLFGAAVAVKPITLDEDNELIDGRHRVEALRRMGLDTAKAFTAKTGSRVENILESVRANLGGSLPPTQADFEHTIEVLINQGLKKHEILDNFPLPKPITSKYYKSVTNQIYKRKIGRAVESVIRGDLSLIAAADKWHVKHEDLRAVISNRKERGLKIGTVLGQVESRVRSLSILISKQATILILQYKDGALETEELKKFKDRIKDSTRRISQNAEQVAERIQAVLDGQDLEDETEDEKEKVLAV